MVIKSNLLKNNNFKTNISSEANCLKFQNFSKLNRLTGYRQFFGRDLWNVTILLILANKSDSYGESPFGKCTNE